MRCARTESAGDGKRAVERRGLVGEGRSGCTGGVGARRFGVQRGKRGLLGGAGMEVFGRCFFKVFAQTMVIVAVVLLLLAKLVRTGDVRSVR